MNLTRVTTVSIAALVLSLAQLEAQVVSVANEQPRNDAGFMAIKRSFNATDLTVVPGVACDNEEKDCELTSAIAPPCAPVRVV